MGEGVARSIRNYQREASDAASGGIGIWPPECIESERRFGVRVARLYPFLHNQKRKTNVGAVRAGGRVGTLHQAFSTGCLVELMAERRFVKGDPKQGPIMRQFAVEDVVPRETTKRRRKA